MSDPLPPPEPAPRRPQLILGTLSVSILIHAAAVALLGGVVVFKIFERPTAQFIPPPPSTSAKIEPRKLEHRIKVKQQQQSGGRPRVSPRMTANGISAISLPDIEADPQAGKIKSNIQNNLGKNFSLSGSGSGLGTGSGSGGLGIGTSAVTFFGIKAAGERIVFIVDLSRSMVEDDKGGLDGINVLKKELKDMVRNLNDGTFFDMIFFDGGVDLFKPQLVIAKPAVKKEAEEFITPYYGDFGKEMLKNYSQGNRNWPSATRLHNYRVPTLKASEKWLGSERNEGNSSVDIPIIAAFGMKADTIFIISDGSPAIRRAFSPKEREEHERKVKEAQEQIARMNPKDVEKLEQKAKETAEAYWKKVDEENARRARRGLPPKVTQFVAVGGPPLPFAPGPPLMTTGEIIEYLRDIATELYGPDKNKHPRIYTISYGTKTAGEIFLKDLAREFKGRNRAIRGLAPPVTNEP